MSFSSEVKNELSKVNVDLCCMKAELYSIIRFRSSLMISKGNFKIEIITTLNATARRIVFLFKKIYEVNSEILVYQKEKLDSKARYAIITQDKGTYILKDLGIIDENYNIIDSINYQLFEKECCQISAIRGAFLIQGSINDPSKSSYHLEIVASSLDDANFLCEILNRVNIVPKIIKRPKGYILYIKKSEQIGDFLRFTGAINSLFYFEDQRIKRDYNNYANKLSNCDIANQEKTLKASAKQLEEIEYLQKYYTGDLDDRLINAINLRLKNPEDSLSELSIKSDEEYGRYISKSGLSHCFKDISIKVQQIKKNRGEID